MRVYITIVILGLILTSIAHAGAFKIQDAYIHPSNSDVSNAQVYFKFLNCSDHIITVMDVATDIAEQAILRGPDVNLFGDATHKHITKELEVHPYRTFNLSSPTGLHVGLRGLEKTLVVGDEFTLILILKHVEPLEFPVIFLHEKLIDTPALVYNSAFDHDYVELENGITTEFKCD